MNLKSWMNNVVLGRVLIIVGTIAVLSALFPIYLFESSHDWAKTSATVTKTKVIGTLIRFRRLITYTYEADGKIMTSSQILPRDPWVDELKEEAKVPVRYSAREPKMVLIDHPQVWQNLLLAAWNAIWIVIGFVLIKRK